MKFTEQQSELGKPSYTKAVVTEAVNEDVRYQDTKRFLDDIKNEAKIISNPSEKFAMEKRISQLNNLVKNSTCLILKVLNPDKSNKNISILKINAMGLFGSKRKYKDGCVYFGYMPEKINNLNDDIDVNLPIRLTENIIDEKSIGRHFQIEYKLDTNKYCVRDLGVGFGTFAKLDFPLILKDNHLIHIGESYIVVNILDQLQGFAPMESIDYKPDGSIQLRLKIFGVNNKGETYVFPSSKQSIYIGRNQDCDIQILDKLLSKCHCFINYNEKDGWTLCDGKDGQHPSTNGTWLFTNEDFEVYDKLVFKSNQTVFQVNLLKLSVFFFRNYLSNYIFYKFFL